MVLVSLEAELRDRERHEAIHLGEQTMPLNQHVECRHRERETCLEIGPYTVHYLLEVADYGEHRQDGLNEDAIIPLSTPTELEIRRIPVGRMKGGIAQHEHLVCHLPDKGLKSRVMDIGCATLPRHHQAEPIDQQAQLAADDPAMVREAFAADLVGAAALPYRMDQLEAIGVNDPQQRRNGQERGGPGPMGPEEPKEPRALGHAREQRTIVPL